MRRAITFLAAVVLLALVVTTAGCSSKKTAAKTVEVQGAEMKFTPATIDLSAATYTFHFANVGAVAHELAIFQGSEPLGRRSIGAGQAIDLPPIKLTAGTYRMRCEEPGHAEAGMVGTITVT